MIAEKPQLQIVTSWDRLRQVLLRAIDRQRYHFGYVFERVEQDGSGLQVYFANGRTERADLLVGCDGFRSTVRAHLAPEVQPIYSGYYIWRGAPNESDLSPDTRRTMFPYFSFFLGDQLQARRSLLFRKTGRTHGEAKEACYEIADGSEKADATKTSNDGQTTDERQAAEHCKAWDKYEATSDRQAPENYKAAECCPTPTRRQTARRRRRA